MRWALLGAAGVLLLMCATPPFRVVPHPTPAEIADLARPSGRSVLEVVPPFAIRLIPSTTFVGQAIWVQCYVPTHYGPGRLRYGIEGLRMSEGPLEHIDNRLLVTHVPCGHWTARCLLWTAQGLAIRAQAFTTLACDGWWPMKGV